MRSISHSEISALLDCQAKHDFAYVGQLAGAALKPKTTAAILSDGRAWGAGVASWHSTQNPELAHAALTESLEEDAEQQREQGLHSPQAHTETLERLGAMLDHYTATAEPLPIDRLEHEIEVAIPSRAGRRRSNAYRLLCKLDGVHIDHSGRHWIVEFKLRGQLTSLEQIALSRQVRWYAWAWREQTGIQPAGVIVDERFNAVPSPVKFNQNGTVSKVQSCQPDVYFDACQSAGHPPDPDVLDKLAAKRWQQRHPVLFRQGELDEVGRQLVSAARLAHGMDTALLWPIRNPSRMRCPGCAFKDICPNPGDSELVDALYTRVPAKRERKEQAVAA